MIVAALFGIGIINQISPLLPHKILYHLFS